MITAVTPDEKNSHILHTIKSYGKGLMGFIRKRVKSDEDAEDILQDVWYQLSSIVNAEPIEQTGAWLYRVAKNKIIDKHRKKTEELFEDNFTEDDSDNVLDFRALLLTEASTPETVYLKNLFWEQLFIALDELPEQQKQVFIWQELDHMSFSEIALNTGENIQTLVSRKRYAVLHLRKRLHQL
ncbi:MAG: sigma-70 family polymerase sigma factor [Daejeonella sp.]|nr:sigma-70 family polymerase sigma factor [Daejeonella sp.]